MLLMLLSFISCKESNSRNAVEMNTLKKEDSVTVKPKLNEVLPRDFVTLKNEFNNNSKGRVDSTLEIPFPLVNGFMVPSLDTSFNNSINPVKLIENKFGYFFIIKVNCIAGGACATFHLLAFDKKGRFAKSIKLGMLAAEEDNSDYFEYKIISDTSLTTYEINYDEEKGKAIDTVTKRIELTIPANK